MEGELVSLKSQLQSLESDFKEFKDVNKKYTDQLIRVKVEAVHVKENVDTT